MAFDFTAPTDLGVLRSLQSCTDERGFFTVLAFDHPASFVLGAPSDAPVDEAMHRQAVRVKWEIAAKLGAQCSAVLVDPEAGLPAAVGSGALPGRVGLMLCIEAESYQVRADARVVTRTRPGWSAAKIRRAGGDGLKLLWRYRHDVPEAAAHRAVVRELAAQCAAASLPFIVEPIWVPLPGEDLADPAVRAARVRAVVEYAALAEELGADIVKTEFPGWVGSPADEAVAAAACQEITERVRVPWLLLSAGVTYHQFLEQTEIASKAGASGFIAGRAVWSAAASPDAQVREEGLRLAAERLDRLTAVVHAYGRPWRVAAEPDAVLGQYRRDWYSDWSEESRRS